MGVLVHSGAWWCMLSLDDAWVVGMWAVHGWYISGLWWHLVVHGGAWVVGSGVCLGYGGGFCAPLECGMYIVELCCCSNQHAPAYLDKLLYT